ncbi:reticulon-4 receptor-like 2 [Littorina saxatilis]|uniref:reticulon-4 receptor-like 2 n=1 Tax=Littorina saxatilis TaxID=31220 RepID=UPI0038B4528E
MVLVLLWLMPGTSGCEASTCVRPPTCWSTRVPESHPPRHQCPDNDLCRCSNTTLDCSSHYGNLTYVPYDEGSFRILNFSNNALRRISSTDFFANVSDTVRVVDLFKNNLVHIVPGVFDRLSKLEWLQLGGNPLSFKDVFAVNFPATVKNLDVQCMGYLEEKFSHLFGSLTKLTVLDIGESKVGLLYSETFASFTGLTWLYLYGNALTYIPDGAFDGMQSLTFLHMDSNRIQTISQFTFGKKVAKRPDK